MFQKEPAIQVPHPGFSLVELLVATGIIPVLIAILLPIVGRIRESSRQIVCSNNLQQLGLAFVMYAHDNDDLFPYYASRSEPSVLGEPEDWIYWQTPRKLALSPILRYTSVKDASLLVCPDDDVLQHGRHIFAYPYPYSYTFSQLLGSNYSSVTPIIGVVNPSAKIMLVEEDPWSIDDGNWAPQLVGASDENFLAIRHDRRVVNDTSAKPSPLNIDCRGNVCFVDGHCEFISRRDSQSTAAYMPRQ